MLDEYKELFKQCANTVNGWENLSKNELCIRYVENKENPALQNAYFSAIMYRYWNLISKYYYMSCNVATPEDCYEWLEDSVYGCLKASSWERPDSSIYKDPNGPDKVINRCMKCARLTFYQFINRKKRKNNFGLQSLDELKELYGAGTTEPQDNSFEDDASSIMIQDYIRSIFIRKDYFLAFMLDCIDSKNTFDITADGAYIFSKFKIKKLVKVLSQLDDSYVDFFAHKYKIERHHVQEGFEYFKRVNPNTFNRRIQYRLEELKHDVFFKTLRGDICVN